MRKTEADWNLEELFESPLNWRRSVDDATCESDIEKLTTYLNLAEADSTDPVFCFTNGRETLLKKAKEIGMEPQEIILPDEVQNIYKMMPLPPKVSAGLVDFVRKMPDFEERLPKIKIRLKEEILPMLTKIGQHIGGDFYRAMDDGLDRVLLYGEGRHGQSMTVGGWNHPAYSIVDFDNTVEGGRLLMHELAHLIHLDISRKNQAFKHYRPTPFLAEVVASTIEHIYFMVLMMVMDDKVHGKGAEARGVFEYAKFVFRSFYQGLALAKAQENYEDLESGMPFASIHSRYCKHGGVVLVSEAQLESVLGHKNWHYPHEQANYVLAHIAGMHVAAALWESHIPEIYARGFNRLLASGNTKSPHTLLLNLMCDITSERAYMGPANLFGKLRSRLNAVDL